VRRRSGGSGAVAGGGRGGYTLCRRPDTLNYYTCWCTPGSGRFRRVSTRTSDLDEAKRGLIAFATERRVALLDVLSAYVASLEGRPSISSARSSLKHWSAFCEREDIVWVSELTPPMQDRFIDRRRRDLVANGHTGSNGTIQRQLGVLKAALQHARRHGALSETPHVASIAQPPPRQRYLTEDEVRRLLAECHAPHLRLFALLALHTLQRPTAIFELTTDRVDFARRRIDFNRPDRPATTKRRAVTPINDSLVPVLRVPLRRLRAPRRDRLARHHQLGHGHVEHRRAVPVQRRGPADRLAARRRHRRRR